MFMVNKVLCVC